MIKSQRLLLVLCFSLAGVQSALAQSQTKPDDVAATNQVVESFRTSLISKDKATYMDLFFSDKPEDIGWQFVSEDTRLKHIKKTKSDAIKARKISSNNFISLIDGTVAIQEPREESLTTVSIETDGEIASVSFDYAFLANGKRPIGEKRCGSSSAPKAAGRFSLSFTLYATNGLLVRASNSFKPTPLRGAA